METKGEQDERKPLSEIIKEADEKGLQVVILEDGAEIGKHAELIATIAKGKQALFVCMSSLPMVDQMELEKKRKNESLPFPKEEPIPYGLNPNVPYDCTVDLKDNKPWYSKFDKKRGKKKH